MVEIKKDFGQTGSAGDKTGGGPTHANALRDIADDLAALKASSEPLRTGPLSAALVDKGSDATMFKTTNAFNYKIAGVIYTYPATDDIADPETTTGAGEFVKELISIDAAGSITVTAGDVAASQVLAVKPSVPANEVEIGWLELPENFTAATTSLTSGMCNDNADDTQPSVGTLKTTKG